MSGSAAAVVRLSVLPRFDSTAELTRTAAWHSPALQCSRAQRSERSRSADRTDSCTSQHGSHALHAQFSTGSAALVYLSTIAAQPSAVCGTRAVRGQRPAPLLRCSQLGLTAQELACYACCLPPPIRGRRNKTVTDKLCQCNGRIAEMFCCGDQRLAICEVAIQFRLSHVSLS